MTMSKDFDIHEWRFYQANLTLLNEEEDEWDIDLTSSEGDWNIHYLRVGDDIEPNMWDMDKFANFAAKVWDNDYPMVVEEIKRFKDAIERPIKILRVGNNIKLNHEYFSYGPSPRQINMILKDEFQIPEKDGLYESDDEWDITVGDNWNETLLSTGDKITPDMWDEKAVIDAGEEDEFLEGETWTIIEIDNTWISIKSNGGGFLSWGIDDVQALLKPQYKVVVSKDLFEEEDEWDITVGDNWNVTELGVGDTITPDMWNKNLSPEYGDIEDWIDDPMEDQIIDNISFDDYGVAGIRFTGKKSNIQNIYTSTDFSNLLDPKYQIGSPLNEQDDDEWDIEVGEDWNKQYLKIGDTITPDMWTPEGKEQFSPNHIYKIHSMYIDGHGYKAVSLTNLNNNNESTSWDFDWVNNVLLPQYKIEWNETHDYFDWVNNVLLPQYKIEWDETHDLKDIHENDEWDIEVGDEWNENNTPIKITFTDPTQGDWLEYIDGNEIERLKQLNPQIPSEMWDDEQNAITEWVDGEIITDATEVRDLVNNEFDGELGPYIGGNNADEFMKWFGGNQHLLSLEFVIRDPSERFRNAKEVRKYYTISKEDLTNRQKIKITKGVYDLLSSFEERFVWDLNIKFLDNINESDNEFDLDLTNGDWDKQYLNVGDTITPDMWNQEKIDAQNYSIISDKDWFKRPHKITEFKESYFKLVIFDGYGKQLYLGFVQKFLKPEYVLEFNVNEDKDGRKAFSREVMDLSEGRYDSLTNQLARNTIRVWKEQYDRGEKELYYLEEVNNDEFEFEYDLTLQLVDTPNHFSIHPSSGADHKADPPFITGKFFVSEDALPQEFSYIYEDLVDFLRHEIEHLTQAGPNLKPGKKRNTMKKYREKFPTGENPKGKYPIMRDEIEPHLHGLYMKAKKTKTPFKDVVKNELDRRGYTPEERKKIIQVWKQYVKRLSLPPLDQ